MCDENTEPMDENVKLMAECRMWNPSDEDIETMASMCHEANRALCLSQGDLSQERWSMAADWQKDSARNGVKLHVANPRANGRASHDCWMEEKLRAGWRYGETKNAEAKTHPCLLPYEALPPEQKIKDDIFRGIVRAYVDGMRKALQ